MDPKQNERLMKKVVHKCTADAKAAFTEGSYGRAVMLLKGLPLLCISAHPQWLSPEEHGAFFNDLGLALKRFGRFKEAISAYQNAAHTGPESERATYANNLSVAHYEMGQFQQAYAQVEEAISRVPENSCTWAFYIVNRCTYDLATGQYLRAARFLKTSLDLYYKNVPAGDEIAHAIERCGMLLTALGYTQEAIRVLSDALGRKKALWGGCHPRVGDSAVVLAEAHIVAGQWAEASSLIEQALSAYKDRVDQGSPYIGRCRMLQGHLADRLGQPRQRCFDEAMSIFKAAYDGNDHPDVARVLALQGEATARRGDYRTAMALFTRARAVRVSGPCASQAEIENNLGYCFLRLSEVRAAWTHFIQSRKLFLQFAKSHPYLTDLYRNMQDALVEMRHPRLAEYAEGRIGTSIGQRERVGISLMARESRREPVQRHDASGIHIMLIGSQDNHQEILSVLDKRLQVVKSYYGAERFIVDWSVCTNLEELARQIKTGVHYQTVSAVVYEPNPEPVPISQELIEKCPWIVDYQHVAWLDVAIALLHRQCDMAYVYCDQVETVSDRFKRETRQATAPMYFKRVSPDNVSRTIWQDLNRCIVTRFEEFIQTT